MTPIERLNRAQFAGWLSTLPDAHNFKCAGLLTGNVERCAWCPLAAYLNTRAKGDNYYRVSATTVYVGPGGAYVGVIPAWAMRFIHAFDDAEREDKRTDAGLAKKLLEKIY